MNCAEKFNEICTSLEGTPDLFIVDRECLDSWDKDNAVFMVYLVEEDYRDYDSIMCDVIDGLIQGVGPKVSVLYGTDSSKSEFEYVLNIHKKFGGLAVEFELYKTQK